MDDNNICFLPISWSPANVLCWVAANKNKNKNTTVTYEDVNRYFDTPTNKSTSKASAYIIRDVKRKYSLSAMATLKSAGEPSLKSSTIFVPCGPDTIHGKSSPHIVHMKGFRRALAAMVQGHGYGRRDILLLSPKGEGKNALAQEFSSLLGYETHLLASYSEMSSLVLLLLRGTDSKTGDTVWEETPPIRAAREGDVCRMIKPKDGVDIQSKVAIHPSFRVVALASSCGGTQENRSKMEWNQYEGTQLLYWRTFHVFSTIGG